MSSSFNEISLGPLLLSAKDIKHKISFLLQKQEPQQVAQKPTKEKDEDAAKRSEDNFIIHSRIEMKGVTAKSL